MVAVTREARGSRTISVDYCLYLLLCLVSELTLRDHYFSLSILQWWIDLNLLVAAEITHVSLLLSAPQKCHVRFILIFIVLLL